MNINRNNYEEYFLLYADNELSAEAKNIVEMFVKENSDLEEEFIMLQQSVLKPDNAISLPNKSSLFKQGDFIDETNFQEKFLLFADNELSLAEIEETEKFVLANPSLQDDFTLLQQVKCQPDNSIVFPDKSLLYKKEERAKVIPFNWRYLAAAVLIGLGLWTGISYLQKGEPETIVVFNETTEPKNNITQQKNDEAVNVIRKDEDERSLAAAELNEQKNNNKMAVQNLQTVATNKIQQIDKTEVPPASSQPKEELLAVNNSTVNTEVVKPSNDLPQPIHKISDVNSKPVETVVAPVSNYAQPATFIEEEVKSENYVFYNITTEEFRKSKVGTFLKKVKRSVERKLPIKGNGLRIGKVEIYKEEN